jgi:hypothetical protein
MHKMYRLHLVCLALVACNTPSWTPEGDIEDEDGEAAELESASAQDQGLRDDARLYAERYSVGLDEAMRRISLQLDLGDVDALVRAKEDSYAGIWIQHTPDFRIVVALTGDTASSRVVAAVRAVSKNDEIEVRTVPWSLAELEKHEDATLEMARTLDVNAEADVNVFENRVELYVVKTDLTKLTTKLNLAEQTLYPSVHVVGVDQLSQSLQLNGGVTLRNPDESLECTAGFTVRTNTGYRGILTAGHCGDTLEVVANGPPLPVTVQKEEGHVDAQWHSACGVYDVSDDFHVCSNFADPACVRDVAATVHRDNQVIGSWVCKYGMTTHQTCGTIQSKNFDPFDPFHSFSPTFVRVDGGNIQLANSGDSGGPWFSGNNAYGILKGAPGEDVKDAIYTPINYITELTIGGFVGQVSVNTGDPSGPGCTLCLPRGNACLTTFPGDCCSNACIPLGVGAAGTCG